MPPEVNEGNYDEKSDIYSLGLVLFEMLKEIMMKNAIYGAWEY